MDTTVKLLDLSNIKSAERYVGGEATQKLLDRTAAVEKEKGANPSPHTTVTRNDDGVAKVRKHYSLKVAEPAKPGAAELQKLAEANGMEWRDGFEDRVIAYWASDEAVDREGDIVRQNWDFTEFDLNPVMPFSHEWHAPPIGGVIQRQVVRRTDGVFNGPALTTLNLFAPEDVWEFADTIFRLVRSGFLKTSSVGFSPGVVIDVKDEGERETLGLGRWGFILDENSLIEHSPTTIPANPGAFAVLRSAKQSGDLKAHDVLAIREMNREAVRRGAGDLTAWKAQEAAWLSVWACLFPDAELSEHKDLDVPLLMDSKTIGKCTGGEGIDALAEKIDRISADVKEIQKIGQDTNLATNDLVKQVEDAVELIQGGEPEDDKDAGDDTDDKQSPGNSNDDGNNLPVTGGGPNGHTHTVGPNAAQTSESDGHSHPVNADGSIGEADGHTHTAPAVTNDSEPLNPALATLLAETENAAKAVKDSAA